MSGATLSRVDLTGAQLAAATLDDAELAEVTLVGADLDSASLRGARIVRCSFVRTQMSVAKLERARIVGSDFSRSDLERSLWRVAHARETKFEGVRFGDADLDEVTFIGCPMHGASFASVVLGIPPTTRGARFENCDLRNTDWRGRDLRGSVLVGCRLEGMRGTAWDTLGMTIEGCDLDRTAVLDILAPPN